jgi:hypothetical protein
MSWGQANIKLTFTMPVFKDPAMCVEFARIKAEQSLLSNLQVAGGSYM